MAYQFPTTPAPGASWMPNYGQPFHNNQQQNSTPTIPAIPQSLVQPVARHAATYNAFGHDANAHIRPPMPPFPFPPPIPEMFKQMSAATFPPPHPAFPQMPSNAMFPPFSATQSIAGHPLNGQNVASHDMQVPTLSRQQSQMQGDVLGRSQHMSIDTPRLDNQHGRDSRSDGMRQGQGPILQSQTALDEPAHNEVLDDAAMDLQISPFPDDGKGFSIFQDAMRDDNEHGEMDGDREDSYDPMRPFLTHTESIHRKQSHTASARVNGEPKAVAYEVPTLQELKISAKLALGSLALHNIKYQDLVREGISTELLTALYTELGLDMKAEATATTASMGTVPVPAKVEGTADLSNSIATPPTSNGLTSGNIPAITIPTTSIDVNHAGQALATIPPVPSVSPGMERKDRIAQLLAAKAGRATSVRTTPELSTPVPSSKPLLQLRTAETIPPTRATTVQKPNELTPDRNTVVSMKGLETRTSPTQQHQEAKQNANALTRELHRFQEVTGTAVSGLSGGPELDRSIVLTTPLREHLVQNGFGSMIPGLFMTSDDVSQNNPVADVPDTDDKENEPSQLPPSTKSQKRGLHEGSLNNAEPPAKRVSIDHGSAPDVDMAYSPGEEASEGEVVEEDSRGEIAGHALTDAVSSLPPKDGFGEADLPSTAIPILATQQLQPDLEAQHHLLHVPSKPPTPITILPKSSFNTSQPAANTPENASASKPTPPVRTMTKLTPAEFAERAAALKANVLRQRALRQKQLKEELPDLDAEIMRTGHRLSDAKEQLHLSRQKIAELRDQITAEQDRESELVAEVALLEKQMQDGVAGQKKFADELDNLNAKQTRDSSRPESLQSPVTGPETSPLNPMAVVEDSTVASSSMIESTTNLQAEQQDLAATHETVAEDLPKTSSPQNQMYVNEVDVAAVTAKESATSPSPPSHDARSNTQDDNSSMDLDDDTDDSASMMSSSSEDYEPAEPESKGVLESTSNAGLEDDDYDPEVAVEQSYESNMQIIGNEDNEDYEPTDEVPGTSALPSQVVTPSHPSPESPVTNGLRDTSELVSDIVPNALLDDVEKPYQLTEADQTVSEKLSTAESITSLPALDSAPPTKSPHFVPYSSPLASFKTFRFHPKFHDLVRNGYRSLTYSYNIDPRRPICPTELAGETCTDPHCEEQHFRSMALTDDKILVQLSSASDLKEKSQRDQYLLGLKQVIADLRSRGVKEFDSVAEALSQYRRDFWKRLEQGDDAENESHPAVGQDRGPAQPQLEPMGPGLAQLVAKQVSEDQQQILSEDQTQQMQQQQMPPVLDSQAGAEI